MKIPTRILRAKVEECDPYPPQLTEQQLRLQERIHVIGTNLYATYSSRDLSFNQFAEALKISPRALKYFYVDIESLIGGLIRRHLMALAAELGKIPWEAENRAAKMRRAYYNYTHKGFGALTDAHTLFTREAALLPDDERQSIDTIALAMGQNIAGYAGVEALRLLDTPYLPLERIEELLFPNQPPLPKPEPTPEPEPEPEPEQTKFTNTPPDDDLFDIIDNLPMGPPSKAFEDPPGGKPGSWVLKCGIPLQKPGGPPK